MSGLAGGLSTMGPFQAGNPHLGQQSDALASAASAAWLLRPWLAQSVWNVPVYLPFTSSNCLTGEPAAAGAEAPQSQHVAAIKAAQLTREQVRVRMHACVRAGGQAGVRAGGRACVRVYVSSGTPGRDAAARGPGTGSSPDRTPAWAHGAFNGGAGLNLRATLKCVSALRLPPRAW